MNYKGGVAGGSTCIYIYTTSRNSVPMTHIRSQREAASRGNDDFSETGGILLQRSKYTADLYQGYAIYIIDIVGNQI